MRILGLSSRPNPGYGCGTYGDCGRHDPRHLGIHERDEVRDSGEDAPGRRRAECQGCIVRETPVPSLRVLSLNGRLLARVALTARDPSGRLCLTAVLQAFEARFQLGNPVAGAQRGLIGRVLLVDLAAVGTFTGRLPPAFGC
jgi:hypothetical protein